MAGQSLNFFALFSLTNFMKTSFSLMTPIRTQRNISCHWLNSSSIKEFFSRANYINGSLSLSCLLLRNMWKKAVLSTCAGAATIRWQIKNKTSRILNTKAQIDRLGFSRDNLRIGKIRNSNVLPILAFSVFTRNRQYGKML